MTMRTWTDEELDRGLALTFDSDAGDGLTVRQYLCELLLTLWKEGESFDGKRPFGNSSWEFDVYRPLIAAKMATGELDADGNIESVDYKEADSLVSAMIRRALS